jgi:hypothetical protein
MATIAAESTTSDGNVRLSSAAPEVARSASAPDRFTVKFDLDGAGLLELQSVLTARMVGVGVERVSRIGTTVSLHGVEQGREGEVFHELQAAIDDVNGSRKAASEVAEQRRSATEAADAASEVQLQAVRESFATAARSSAPSSAPPSS